MKAVAHPRFAIATAALLTTLALCSSVSAAGPSHVFKTTYGSATSNPANPYPLSEPTDVQVDQTTRDFYVTDPGNHRVEKFDAAGNFLLMFGKGVDKETGANVCTAASGDVCQAGESAASGGAFEIPYYLAVDNSHGASAGDVYVGDTGDNQVSKFDSGGHLISGWGAGGQKDGSDAEDLPGFGPLDGVAVTGPQGTLLVGGTHYSDDVWSYKQDGTYIQWYADSGAGWLRGDAAGNFYFPSLGNVRESIPIGGETNQDTNEFVVGTGEPVQGFDLDPVLEELYQNAGTTIYHYNNGCTPPPETPCAPGDSFGASHLFEPKGLGVDGTSRVVYVANAASNDVAAFEDVRPVATTDIQASATETTITLAGDINPAGHGNINSCRFEYGFDKTYGHTTSCSPDPAGSNFITDTPVTAVVGGLSAGTIIHYRVVGTNVSGAISYGVDKGGVTSNKPAVDGLSSANLTPETADLRAQVNPNGLETTYRFEYGTSTSYDHSAPIPDGDIAASNSDQAIEVHLEGLQPHAVYHYRLVATNEDGTASSADQTFNFYPPPCPNENVRQQTEANYLPDCRAYELVSPGDAGGTQLFAAGPNTGEATSPSRFAYAGLFSTIPGTGGKPIDGSGDLYVATRTDSGWVSKYVGWPSDQAALDGGPTMGPPGSSSEPYQTYSSNLAAVSFFGTLGQNGVLTDEGMNTFLSFNDGNQSVESIFGADFQNHSTIASNAPYVISADGHILDRWPTNLGSVPNGSYAPWQNIYNFPGYFEKGSEQIYTAPGGSHALDCASVKNSVQSAAASWCPGDVTASADLNHFVFASEWNVFAPGGQLSPPGSVYDNTTSTDNVAVASKTPSGEDIPSEPGDQSGDPLQIPFVSKDGSHILMASGGNGPCGYSTCPVPPCGDYYSAVIRCPMQPSHLYMRVDGSLTYDVSHGADVEYQGATSDGTKVYFTTPQQLTPEDTDNSIDLYMWSQQTDSIKLISIGNNGNGNSDSCSVGFVAKCGVALFTTRSYCELTSDQGGNCLSDNFIAGESGDIYFFSPERLDGSRGAANQENLYVYRNEQVKFVASFSSNKQACFTIYGYATQCTPVQALRMQVSPDGKYMAFVTGSQVTQYDNAGHLEMYRYDAERETLVCVSCIPSGAPPTSDVGASQDGLFMTDDGRTFFTTNDPLVHTDTNNALDVYEYVDGRAQLISPGTGDTTQASTGFFSDSIPGFVGVSADGRDVYFSTYDTLVPQDHNGLFIKFYDARSGGGFAAPAPPPPCAAADECHGPGSSSPEPVEEGTGARLGGGNVQHASKKKKGAHGKHRHRRPHKHGSRNSRRNRGTSR